MIPLSYFKSKQRIIQLFVSYTVRYQTFQRTQVKFTSDAFCFQFSELFITFFFHSYHREKEILKGEDLQAFENENNANVRPIGLIAQKMTLPPGTQRRDTQEFEEVKIPAPTIPPLSSDERFVPITEFDEWAQVVFKVRSFIFSMCNRPKYNLFKGFLFQSLLE
jgi:hypothetical protein